MRLNPKTLSFLLVALLIAGLLISVFAFLIAPTTSVNSAMQIDPGQSQRTTSDRELTIELTGDGLPDDLRASISRDISNHDQIIDWFNLPGNAQRFVINGQYGYLATGYQGLHIIDIDNPKSLRVLGSVESHGLAWDLIVRDQTVFLTVDGLQVIDVSQPAAPKILATLTLPDTILLDLVIAGNTLYAGSAKGLQIFDITDISVPRHVGSLAYEGGPWALAIKDNLLLLSLRDQKREWLKILDISRPFAPKEISSTQLPRKSWGISVRGQHAYLPVGKAGISIIDISNPGTPQLLATVNEGYYVDFITINKDRAYCTSRRGDFNIFQIDTATRLRLIGEVGLPPMSRPVVLRNDIAYVASGIFGLLSVDVLHPRQFNHTSTRIVSDAISSIQNRNDLFYLSDSESGILIAQRSNKNSGIEIISELQLPSGAKKSARISNLMCVLEQTGNRAIFINVTDPSKPQRISELTIEKDIRDVVANMTHFFIIDRSRLLIIDAADPTHPQIVSSTPIDDARKILVDGSHLFVVKTGTELLTVFDVSDPKNPIAISHYQLPWQLQGMLFAYDLTLANNRLVLSCGQPELLVFDVSQIKTPVLVRGINLGEGTRAINYFNKQLYVTTDSGILWVLKQEGETFIQVAATRTMGLRGTLQVDNDGSALLAGNGRGLSFIPLPQAIPVSIVTAQKHLRLRIPAGLKPGRYQVDLIAEGALIPYTTVRIDPAPEETPAQKL